jgi:hypothetical protein
LSDQFQARHRDEEQPLGVTLSMQDIEETIWGERARRAEAEGYTGQRKSKSLIDALRHAEDDLTKDAARVLDKLPRKHARRVTYWMTIESRVRDSFTVVAGSPGQARG